MGRDFVIFDPSDQKSLVKQVLTELKLPEKQFHPKKVLELISELEESLPPSGGGQGRRR